MMCSRILKEGRPKSKLSNWIGDGLKGLGNRYESSLQGFMNHKWISFAIILGSVALVFGLGRLLPSELAPLEDKGRLRIFSTAPEGTSYEMMDAYIKQIVDMTDTLPEKESLLSVTSPGFGSSNSINSGFVRLTLWPSSQREKSQMQLASELSEKMRDYNFARSFVVQEQTIQVGGGGRGLPVQFVVQAPTIKELKEIIPPFMAKASESPVFDAVDLDLKFNKPELTVEIDRNKAREMGVEVADIAQTLQLLYSG